MVRGRSVGVRRELPVFRPVLVIHLVDAHLDLLGGERVRIDECLVMPATRRRLVRGHGATAERSRWARSSSFRWLERGSTGLRDCCVLLDGARAERLHRPPPSTSRSRASTAWGRRRQGLGRALTALPVRDALDRACRTATLQSTPMAPTRGWAFATSAGSWDTPGRSRAGRSWCPRTPARARSRSGTRPP
jgi:hypothetical protein